jgi:hypothetical protein
VAEGVLRQTHKGQDIEKNRAEGDEAVNQGMLTTTRSWMKKELDSSLEPPYGSQSLDYRLLVFRILRIKSCCFKLTSLQWVITRAKVKKKKKKVILFGRTGNFSILGKCSMSLEPHP